MKPNYQPEIQAGWTGSALDQRQPVVHQTRPTQHTDHSTSSSILLKLFAGVKPWNRTWEISKMISAFKTLTESLDPSRRFFPSVSAVHRLLRHSKPDPSCWPAQPKKADGHKSWIPTLSNVILLSKWRRSSSSPLFLEREAPWQKESPLEWCLLHYYLRKTRHTCEEDPARENQDGFVFKR